MHNPILDAPAVREARDAAYIAGIDAKKMPKYLDAYATAILAEVRRRVEGMERLEVVTITPLQRSREPYGAVRAHKNGSYLDRAAVLRILDGRDDA